MGSFVGVIKALLVATAVNMLVANYLLSNNTFFLDLP